MKRTILLLLALLVLTLPLLSLAQETAAPEATAAPTQSPEEESTKRPWGPRRGMRFGQAQPPAFVDENEDGVCDFCGQATGDSASTPTEQEGFTPPAAMQQRRQMMRGRMMQGQMPMMQRRMQMMRSQMLRGCMAGGQGFQQAPQGQGPQFQDQDQDGICDHFQTFKNQQNAPASRPGMQRRFGR